MTALNVKTPPTTEPVTLSELKAFARIEHDDEDSLLTAAIKAARRWAEDYTRRTFITTTYTLYLNSFRDVIEIPRSPLASVVSIKYTDIAGVEQTLDPSVYTVDIVSMIGRIILAYGKSWPSTRDIPHAVRVEFTAGYGAAADVPEEIKLAIRYWAKDKIDDRDNGDAKRPAVLTAESLLDFYRIPL